MRMVPCRVRLVQPLLINIEKNYVNGNHITSVSIENRHEEDINIELVEVNIVQTRELKDKDCGRFEDFVDVIYDKSDFPMNLKENEQYNFVVSFERKPIAVTYQNYDILTSSVPEVHILWSTSSMCGKMLSPVKLPLSLPSKKKLLVTFNTEISPIKAHSIFPLRITITNLSSKARDIALEIPLPELDREHDKFFILGPRKPETQIPTNTSSVTVEKSSILPRLSQVNSKVSLSSIALSPQNKSRRLSLGEDKHAILGDSTEIFEDLINLRNVFSDTSDVLVKFEQSRKKVASIFCLEKVIRLGNIEPKSQTTATLECIAMREGLFAIRNIKVVDQNSSKAYLVQEPCEILVVK